MRSPFARSVLAMAVVSLLVILAAHGKPPLAYRALRHFGIIPRVTAEVPRPGERLPLQQDAFVPVGTGEPAQPTRTKGRSLLIDVFATWCGPCREEFATLALTQPRLARAGIDLTGVDRGESPQQVQEMMESFGLHFPVYIDTGVSPTWASAPHMIPTVILVDERGIVQMVHLGPLTEQQILTLARRVRA